MTRKYETACPACGAENHLQVIEGRWYGSVALTAEGYELAQVQQLNGRWERVECSACEAQFDLDDLVVSAGALRRLLLVSVRASVPVDELSEEDKGVAGVYEVVVPAGIPDAEAASIALDTFHQTQPIGELDLFQITVLDEGGRMLSPDPDHEDYSKGHLGGDVEKVSDTPLTS